MNLVLLCFLLWCSVEKRLSKKVNLNELAVSTQTAFISKFDIGVGSGLFSIKYKLLPTNNKQQLKALNLKMGLISDDQYQHFRTSGGCEEREPLYSQTHTLNFNTSSKGDYKFNINETKRQHIWYLFVWACDMEELASRKSPFSGGIDVDVVMMNNGSHFGEDEGSLIWAYGFLTVAWIVVLIGFFKHIVKSLKIDQPEWTRIFMYSGFILLGLAYFYRFLDLLMVSYNGKGVGFLYILYVVIKNVVEGILVTIIISIAWGWSLTHLKHDQTYVIIGTVSAIVNVVGLIIDNTAEEMETDHHRYDGTLGNMLLLMRVLLFVLFSLGVLRSMTESAGRLRTFLKKFGIMGSLYMIGWPLAVILAEIFLPNYLHQEFVTFIEEGTHLLANALLCVIYTIPESSYRKVNVKDDDGIFPTFSKLK